MSKIEKMYSAIDYIAESNWTDKLKNADGTPISVGITISTAKIIQNLSILAGRATVYLDQSDEENLELLTQAFWDKFENDFDLQDFEDYYTISED